MVWLPDGEKNCEDMITHFDRIHERDRRIDRQTDGQTPHDGIDHGCTASRGKKTNNAFEVLYY